MIPNASIKKVVLALVIGAVAASLYFSPIADWLSTLIDWSRTYPIVGALAYLVFVILGTVLFMPGSVSMLVGGFVFGFLPGFMLAAVAVPLGAQAAFHTGRWVARPWVRNKVNNHPRIQAIELALEEQALLIIILTRLSVILPFNLLNYVYGATGVRSMVYLFATAVGMLPAVALFVYLGTLANDVGQILAGNVAPSALGYWLAGIGIVAIVTATWIIHRTATMALEKHLKRLETAG